MYLSQSVQEDILLVKVFDSNLKGFEFESKGQKDSLRRMPQSLGMRENHTQENWENLDLW